MPQQLKLWQILSVAQADPMTASIPQLCSHLDGLSLTEGAIAIQTITEIYHLKAEAILDDIAAAYFPKQEPVLDDELWAHLYQRSFVLNDDHLYLESEHYYPEERQSVIRLGAEADDLIANELRKAEVLEQVLGNAHSEDIELWAEGIRGVMVDRQEISLLDLQQKSNLSLVDVWLGLLLGDTGCFANRASIDADHPDFDRCEHDAFYRLDDIQVVLEVNA
jgi:hypothetical protein